MGGKQRIMALYQTQPDRSLRAKALAKEYGIGGHSHDYLDGSRGFVNHDGRGMEFDHYPEHKKFTLSWTQVEKYIDLMVQSDRYLTDREKEHYTPPAPVSVKPDGAIDRAKKLIREFCQEEYDSEPDFSDLTKIGIAYTHATDEDIPIQVNVDLVGYRVERYLGEVLIDERQYESLEDLTETELDTLRVKSRTFNGNEKRTPERMDRRFKILHLQRALSGWEGLEFEDGSPIPFSKEMIKELWEVNPNLMGIIYSCVSSELSFVKAAEEKNSVTGADA